MNTANQNFRLIEDIAIASAAYRAVDRVETLFNTASLALRTWSERSRNRKLLSQMDDRMLEDIGLTRADVIAESDKYFWQL